MKLNDKKISIAKNIVWLIAGLLLIIALISLLNFIDNISDYYP